MTVRGPRPSSCLNPELEQSNLQTTQNNNLGHIKNPTYSRMGLPLGMRDRGPPAFTLGWARRAAPQTVELLDLCSTDTSNPSGAPGLLCRDIPKDMLQYNSQKTLDDTRSSSDSLLFEIKTHLP